MSKNTLMLRTVPWLLRHYSFDFPHTSQAVCPSHTPLVSHSGPPTFNRHTCATETQPCANKPLLKPRIILTHSTVPRHLTYNLSKLSQNWTSAISLNLQTCSSFSVHYLDKRTTPQAAHMRKTWESCLYVPPSPYPWCTQWTKVLWFYFLNISQNLPNSTVSTLHHTTITYYLNLCSSLLIGLTKPILALSLILSLYCSHWY